MSAEDAKEYLFLHISALKLTEKKYRDLDGETAKWDNRAALAASRGAPDLAREAEAEALRCRENQAKAEAEIGELKSQIREIRRQIPGLAARERSIDPELLEQEILIALGKTPGEAEDAASEAGKTARAIEGLAADAALDALKVRMGMGGRIAEGKNAAGSIGDDGRSGEGAPA
jgi:chromosome segregation ATPase